MDRYFNEGKHNWKIYEKMLNFINNKGMQIKTPII